MDALSLNDQIRSGQDVLYKQIIGKLELHGMLNKLRGLISSTTLRIRKVVESTTIYFHLI